MEILMVGTNEFPTGATPIPIGKLMLINHDLKNLKQKGHSPVSFKTGEIMWVHPNLLEDKQWSSPGC